VKRKNVSALTWDNAPESLTVAEAAALARIPRNGMYDAVRLGLVPSKNFWKAPNPHSESQPC